MAKTTASDTSASPLNVVVTGDVYLERYIWQQVTADTDEGELPYTWPDELRTAAPTRSFRELSGAPLHALIFDAVLKTCGFSNAGGNGPSAPQVTSVPDYAECLKLVANNEHGGPFPVYLNELEAFSVGGKSGAPDAKAVWRISRSYGEIRQIPRSPAGPLDALEQSVLEMLRRLIAGPATPTVVVINDRNAVKEMDSNTSIRRTFKNCYNQLLKEPNDGVKPPPRDNLLILWHTRAPFDPRFDLDLAEFLEQEMAARTIPIINYNCLRDAGVQLRFDCSYEQSIRALLDSQEHEIIQRLLKFPHVLIRYDYGIMHVTTKGGAIAALDIHGVNSGPYASPNRHGMVTGTTPILIACILRELACLFNLPKPKLDAFLHPPAGKPREPSILNGTRLDRAIDLSLLLAGQHFRRGFGEYVSGSEPEYFEPDTENESGDGSSTAGSSTPNALQANTSPAFKRLIQSVLDSCPTLKQSERKSADPITLMVRRGAFDRLTRLSVDDAAMLGTSHESIAARADFTRIHLLSNEELLGKNSTVVLAKTQDADAHRSEARSQKNASSRQKDDFGKFVLHCIVEHGLDRVVDRSPVAMDQEHSERSGGSPSERRSTTMSNFLVEPSVLCPYIAGGSFLSVDSHEIDATLTIRYLVDKYINQKDWTKPLAIGVFGKPGSGKSSVVRNILSSNADCLLDPSLECNLSQLSSLDALARHFHKVQDMTQREKVPVVFFDEFDSTFDGKPVGWLRYFLMPIQDGMYASANDNYHIGKSVFIFAGGVADTFADFRKRFESREEDKVRDFISRLRGYIDVQDVSFPESLKRRYASSEFVFTVKNRAIQIRRAVILRDLLRRNLRQIFDEGSQTARINKAVVNAFLYVPKYLHGIRSMEAIIQMSRVSSRASSYQPSALPPKSQLAMHVDADSFLRFANEHPQ